MMNKQKNALRTRKSRVLIVDDHPVVREGLAWLVSQESDMEVCGGEDNIADAMKRICATRPDLVVVDLSIKGGNGLHLVSQIKALNKKIKMLVWSMYDETVFAERSLRAGAMGYVNKRDPMATVLTAARHVLGGQIYASPRIMDQILRRIAGNESVERDPIIDLTDRELEVFQLMGQGMTMRNIARVLGVKASTVESHREKIKAKLDIENTAKLAARAVQWVVENG